MIGEDTIHKLFLGARKFNENKPKRHYKMFAGRVRAAAGDRKFTSGSSGPTPRKLPKASSKMLVIWKILIDVSFISDKLIGYSYATFLSNKEHL